ncbi:hypothetical protein [Psychrobacter pygoscelis]|uniref:hypothetical protein n=1 Tax=Psychrobacter pygoscelis TaxID=2488563 RepID=UPI0013F47610|nr:hypothetical protein [Psychrobacter pygoscelis]
MSKSIPKLLLSLLICHYLKVALRLENSMPVVAKINCVDLILIQFVKDKRDTDKV